MIYLLDQLIYNSGEVGDSQFIWLYFSSLILEQFAIFGYIGESQCIWLCLSLLILDITNLNVPVL